MLRERTVVLLTIALVLSLLGAANVEAKKPPRPDTTPPDPVTNLAPDSAATTHQSITLTWTATGDDGSTGQASAYDIRYALDGPMTQAKWDAEPVNQVSALVDPSAVPNMDNVVRPAQSGQAESVEINGLADGTTYYFGVKACDEVGNCSPVAVAAGEATLDAGPGEWSIDIVNTESWLDVSDRKDVDVTDAGQAGVWYVDGADFSHSYRSPGSGWQHELVTGGTDETCLAFAYSPSGVPWAATCQNGSLEAMYRDSPGTWITETVDSVPGTGPVALVHDPATGEPHLAYRQSASMVKHAWRSGGTWNVEVVRSGVQGPGQWLAFHPTEGYPSIAYADLTAEYNHIWFATKEGGTWTSELVHSGSPAWGIQPMYLAYHPIEHYPAVAFAGYYLQGVLYSHRTPSGWTAPEYVDPTTLGETGGVYYGYYSVVLGFGADGTAFMAYHGYGPYDVVRIFANDGTGWSFVHGEGRHYYDGTHDIAGIVNDAAVNPVNGMPVLAFGFEPVKIIERVPPDPGVTVHPTSGLETTEAGGQATFLVRLDTEPSAEVTIGLSSSDLSEGTVSPASLTFTPANWHTVQTVTVTGADDAVFDGDVGYTIETAPAVSTDLDYGGMDADDVSATNLDDEAPPVLTFDSLDVPKAIPDNGTVVSTLDVSAALSIADIDVIVDISHTRDGDLDVFLIAPDSTRIELFTDVGGNGDDFAGTTLDDEATLSITEGSAPFAGTYRPEALLSALDGKSATGTWTLEITDDKKRETGTLGSWSIAVQSAP